MKVICGVDKCSSIQFFWSPSIQKLGWSFNFPTSIWFPFNDRPVIRMSARFNKGVTEKSTQSQFWLSRSYLISCENFIPNFEPALKSRIFEIAIFKISTVLYHVKISLSGWARLNLIFLYIMYNRVIYLPAKNKDETPWNKNFMAKKRSHGHPKRNG